MPANRHTSVALNHMKQQLAKATEKRDALNAEIAGLEAAIAALEPK